MKTILRAIICLLIPLSIGAAPPAAIQRNPWTTNTLPQVNRGFGVTIQTNAGHKLVLNVDTNVFLTRTNGSAVGLAVNGGSLTNLSFLGATNVTLDGAIVIGRMGGETISIGGGTFSGDIEMGLGSMANVVIGGPNTGGITISPGSVGNLLLAPLDDSTVDIGVGANTVTRIGIGANSTVDIGQGANSIILYGPGGTNLYTTLATLFAGLTGNIKDMNGLGTNATLVGTTTLNTISNSVAITNKSPYAWTNFTPVSVGTNVFRRSIITFDVILGDPAASQITVCVTNGASIRTNTWGWDGVSVQVTNTVMVRVGPTNIFGFQTNGPASTANATMEPD